MRPILEGVERCARDVGPDGNGEPRMANALNRRIEYLRRRFVTGQWLAPHDVSFLATAADLDPSLATLVDDVHRDTLLHRCARHDMRRETSVLLRLGADPGARNASGRLPYHLAQAPDVRNVLRAASKGIALVEFGESN